MTYRRRKIKGAEKYNVSLFPFLAVLICTMGTLIVLLVVVVQQAKLHAGTTEQNSLNKTELSEDAQAEKALLVDQLEKLAAKRAGLDFKMEEIQKKNKATTIRLTEIRREKELLSQKKGRLTGFVSRDQSEVLWDQVASLATEKEKLANELAELVESIQRDKEGLGKEPARYALVPYIGRQKSRQRPVYLECTSEGITLQPEGILFKEDDFLGGTKGENHLLHILSKAEGYFRNSGQLENSEEGYLLFIIRPSGVLSYAVARSATAAWPGKFGYELLEGDKELVYPQVDFRLKQILDQELTSLRNNQERLRKAAPVLFEKSAQLTFSQEALTLDKWEDKLLTMDEQQRLHQQQRSGSTVGEREGTSAITSSSQKTLQDHQGQTRKEKNHQGQPPEQVHQLEQTVSLEKMIARQATQWNTQRGIPYTREVKIQIAPRKCQLLTSRKKVVTFEFQNSFQEVMAPLLVEVSREKERWGQAGHDAYWRPKIVFYVDPAQQEEFSRFAVILKQNSILFEQK
ncbi:MAG: hypothetical protein MPJ24_01655 [Pirellulaceae bacterium]|nr:hypothetical protein [Pirellulaceae bacterium]